MLDEIFIYGWVLFRRIIQRWLASTPVITVTGFFIGVFLDMRLYLGCIFVLIILDMITGIAASLHRGERFSSRKLRTGLVERFLLYATLFVITLMIDTILRGTVDYGRDYVAITCCTIIGFYEASSCIENLVSRFPKYLFLHRIGKMLNILDKRYEQSTVQKVADIINVTNDIAK